MTAPSSVKDNLIAARALIDTPEKMAGRCIIRVLDDALVNEPFGSPADVALVSVIVALRAVDAQGIRHRTVPHADVMALFDRAISSQEQSE